MDAHKGNSCLFCIFMVTNFALLFIGFGTIAAGIYVAAKLNSADWYNISFIGLGFLTILVFALGCRAKRSLTGTCCYLISTLFIFVAQLCFTLAIIFNTDFADLLGTSNANSVRYSLLVACVLLLVSFLVGWWYRNTMLISRLFYEDSYEQLGHKGEGEQELSQQKTRLNS